MQLYQKLTIYHRFRIICASFAMVSFQRYDAQEYKKIHWQDRPKLFLFLCKTGFHFHIPGIELDWISKCETCFV